MIEAIVEAEFVLDVVAFVLAAGDADRARALDLRDLPDRRADRAGGRRDHHGLAGLRLADIEQAGIGGHAGHAEHADRGRDRRRVSDRSCAVPCRRRARGSASRRATARCRPWQSPDCSRRSPRTPCRPPSRRRSAPAPHRTGRRSCARAYRDRATARWCAAEPGPRRASAARIPRCGSRTPWARRRGERRERRALPDWDMVVSSDCLFYSSLRGAKRRSNPASLASEAGLLRCARNDGWRCQAVIFASAASNAAAALGRSLKAQPAVGGLLLRFGRGRAEFRPPACRRRAAPAGAIT